jgi:hypothetical protein
MLSLVPTVLLGVCTPDELGRWPELVGFFSTATTTSCRRLAGRPQEEVETRWPMHVSTGDSTCPL